MKRVALTFDTEPRPERARAGNDRAIIDALDAAGGVATFFLQGDWVRSEPGLARRLVTEGHRIANHTDTHALPGEIEPQALCDQIALAERSVIDLAGASPRPYFRCPQNSGAFDEGVLETIRSTGYRQTGWTHDSFDWHDAMDAQTLRRSVVEAVVEHGDGAIVLFHSWPDATADALSGILADLRAAGFTPVTLDALEAQDIPIATVTPTEPPLPSHSLSRSAAWALAAKVATVVANLAIGVVVSRTLGPVGKGNYALIQQIVGILVVVFGLGLATSNTYFVAKRRVSARAATANSLWLAAATTALASVVLFMVLVGPFAPERSYSIAMALVATALFGTSIVFGWVNAISSALAGLRVQSIAAILSLATVTVGTVGLWALRLMSPLAMLALGAAGQLVGSLTVLGMQGRAMMALRPSRTSLRAMVPYASKAYAIDALTSLHLRQDILIIGWLTEPRLVGLYSVAVGVATMVRYLPQVTGAALFARASQMQGAVGSDLAMRLSRIVALLLVVVAVAAAALGPWFITTLYGDRFAEAVPVFLALIPGYLAMGLSEAAAGYLFSTGVIYWRYSLVAVIVTIAANIIVTPLAGILGVAIVSSVTYVAFAIAILSLATRTTGTRLAEWVVPGGEDLAVLRDSAARLLGGGEPR